MSPEELGHTPPNRPHPLKQSAGEVAECKPGAPGVPTFQDPQCRATGQRQLPSDWAATFWYRSIGGTVLLFLASGSAWYVSALPR